MLSRVLILGIHLLGYSSLTHTQMGLIKWLVTGGKHDVSMRVPVSNTIWNPMVI